MDSGAVSNSLASPLGAVMAYDLECLTIPEIMAVVQSLFLKSDFALVEEALRRRENSLKAKAVSTFRDELAKKEAENAKVCAKYKKARQELTSTVREQESLLLKLEALVQAERQTWQEKEEVYKKKVAEMECEPKSNALLEAERRKWQEKEETYNRRIAQLESELRSDAPGLGEPESVHMQAKCEVMKTIEKLKGFEEVIRNLRKDSEELRDLKTKHEVLMEELKEGKRNEKRCGERILELEKELKEKEKAVAKFFEVTSAYMDLEDEKDAAERKATEWKKKYKELEAGTLLHLHPFQSRLGLKTTRL